MTPDDRAPSVLCVDDEASILHALRRIFLDEPWEVHFAPGGEEGLAVIREHPVDLVLADFRMPGMDGVDFLKRVKEIHPDCVRIVLSGYADINAVVSALNEGEIYRFIPKPWNDDELLHNLRKALEHHRLGRENRRLNDELVRLNRHLEQKVDERTRELLDANRTLRFAGVILELIPMPVLAVNPEEVVVFANAQARQLLEQPGEPVVGRPAPAIFQPELSGAVARALAAGDLVRHLMPMVLDGEPVGAIILAGAGEPPRTGPGTAHPAFTWSVTPM